MPNHILTGFGFGPVQAGLFVNEAYQSKNFSRIVIAEIDQGLVDAIRNNKGSYYVNVAGSEAIDIVKIEGIEIYNPNIEKEKQKLLEALAESTEIVTSLPSVSFYDSVASLIAQGLNNSSSDATIVYTAENNNRAAEILEESVIKKLNKTLSDRVQFLNTVIGKMSRIVTEPEQINQKNLKAIAPGIDRAFLVEEFNKILVTKCNIENFTPGIEIFVEKDSLLPFEEAKLYGHNAIHALLAYLGALAGYTRMEELKDDERIMKIAGDAFISESGAALIKKYVDMGDELFTEAGYKAYAEDLIRRMINPYLDDSIKRAARDPIRKLGLYDRIFGTMTLCLEQGIEPVNMALGAASGIFFLLREGEESNLPNQLYVTDRHNLTYSHIQKILNYIWQEDKESKFSEKLISLVYEALSNLHTSKHLRNRLKD